MKLLLITLLAVCFNGISGFALQKMLSGEPQDFQSMMNMLQREMENGKGGNFHITFEHRSFGPNNNANPNPTQPGFFGDITYPTPTQSPMQPATDAGPFGIPTDKLIPTTTTALPPPSEPVASSSTNIKQKNSKKPECTKERRAANHTLCMEDSLDVVMSKSGLTQREKDDILDHHNRLRGLPEIKATDLVKLIWDDQLAEVAQKWAFQCADGHDKNRELTEELGMSVGQNAAGGYRNFQTATQAWWDEFKMWKYGKDPNVYLAGKGGWKIIGHFTQMAQNGTYLLGCGMAYCNTTKYNRHYVCNYANGQSNYKTPYTFGESCSACPRFCSKGVCDCSGRLCKNGGTLDVATCSCKCSPLYKGRECEQLNCPADDKPYCGRGFPPPYCNFYSNVPDECPYMCGKCKGDQAKKYEKYKPKKLSGGQEQNHQVFTSAFGCKYEGIREKNCTLYGDNGRDTRMCQSVNKNGRFGCKECTSFTNVPTKYCPVMCGLCICEDDETCHRYKNKHCSYSQIKAKCPKKCKVC